MTQILTETHRAAYMCHPCHLGYMTGLKGEAPDNELGYPGSDYELGYLHGCEDRENGVTPPIYCGFVVGSELPVRSGMMVVVPKGTVVHSMKSGRKPSGVKRTVKVHHVNPGAPAYRDYHGEFVRPVNPVVVWAGAGSYWHEADINDVTVVTDA